MDGGVPEREGWRRRWHVIIFGSDTPAGRRFDLWLLVAIVLSVGVVMLESVKAVDLAYGDELRLAEWLFTILFTVEYAVRLSCVRRPMGHALSFFGIVDLIAMVFRILKLVHYLKEMEVLGRALRASRRKIVVFISTVLTSVVVLGTLMYLVEGAENGFTSIPRSVYWAIVTLTTVGYGDISPQTPLGQALASIVMILGYGMIAVPTGVVTVEIAQAARALSQGRACRHCSTMGHSGDAVFCHRCGQAL